MSERHENSKSDKHSRWRFWDAFERDPSMEDLEQIAKKIEAMIDKAQLAVIKLADIKSGEVLEAFFDVQSSILRLDESSREKFRQMLEERRVRSLAHDSLIMTGVMSSAVALTVFKNQPKIVSEAPLEKVLGRIRQAGTHPLTLITFTVASLYAVIGRGALRQVSRIHSQKSLRIKPVKDLKP